MVCNEGGFDQILDVLFRTYSRATGGRTITRTEMAAILAKHVMYEELKVKRRNIHNMPFASQGESAVNCDAGTLSQPVRNNRTILKNVFAARMRKKFSWYHFSKSP